MQFPRMPISKRLERGLTLVETLASLGLIAAAIGGTALILRDSQESAKATAVAQYMIQVSQGATRFINDNRSTIQASATDTQPHLIRVSELVSAGYLSGMSATNAYGHNVCVLVLEPAANQLEAILVAEGGQQLDDATLGQISSTIGADGGGVYASAPTEIRGTSGGWQAAIGNFANANQAGLRCDGSAGSVQIQAGRPVVALWGARQGTDGLTAGLLHRNPVPGRPELNAMNTPLSLASVQTLGAACTPNGSVARDTDGGLLSCVGGNWVRAGRAANSGTAAASVAALGACTSSNAGETRLVESAPYSGAPMPPRPYYCSGSQWLPIAQDKDSNHSVTAAINSAAVNANFFVTGPSLLGGNVSANNVVSAGTSVATGSSSNTLTTTGRLQVGSDIVIQTARGALSGCGPNGMIARDSSFNMLFCRGGFWRPISEQLSYTNTAGATACKTAGVDLTVTATCSTAGHTVMGGGYEITNMATLPGGSIPAPYISSPQGSNSWRVVFGSRSEGVCARATITCQGRN